MDYTLCPDTGPPRLIRYTDLGLAGLMGTLALLDKDKNLLLVDKRVYEMLDGADRQRVITTRMSLSYTLDGGRAAITPYQRPTSQRDAA